MYMFEVTLSAEDLALGRALSWSFGEFEGILVMLGPNTWNDNILPVDIDPSGACNDEVYIFTPSLQLGQLENNNKCYDFLLWIITYNIIYHWEQCFFKYLELKIENV